MRTNYLLTLQYKAYLTSIALLYNLIIIINSQKQKFWQKHNFCQKFV